jgi:predicted SprT family Zn-dependent metalloprotease
VTHQDLLQNRKAHVPIAPCQGEVRPIQTRKQWVKMKGETLYRCADCDSVPGVVAGRTEWAMTGDRFDGT